MKAPNIEESDKEFLILLNKEYDLKSIDFKDDIIFYESDFLEKFKNSNYKEFVSFNYQPFMEWSAEMLEFAKQNQPFRISFENQNIKVSPLN